ncbi:hypothetical protein FJV41_18465 [Myxococcus llanfairpwllgwyngyllgogerychwyrndrobwllllantysiliogogogochensis]|uniref:Uncharacterized protein n=1 Tax=Myxococcus llanfairpwllgwyngyllgogerychwyrndrobwllllantysiliogogogochensis TaxID=2590453 RepID=A0A540WZV7_9BACT|nr:hypothetical protein [Myxococcus llanfairpwllgwyngyllgogerychwyrndrobwllllantysiliogogogochensis]TQF14500.1 hypothetical protein FJV41_18465 [Myxococcus llanfairpwllgwyngyllgogerychwyrndrobwllllantysiliogogogochensis]
MDGHWKHWPGVVMLSLGWSCAPDTSGPAEVDARGVQSQAEYDASACAKLQAVPCPMVDGDCPKPEEGTLCFITISLGADPVTPPRSCVWQRHLLKFQLAPGVPWALLKFHGEGADAIFENYNKDDIKLVAGPMASWCRRVRRNAVWKDYPFVVSTDTGEGQPGDLEVVRDPNEPEEE